MTYERDVNRRPRIFNRHRRPKSPHDHERAATMIYVLSRSDGMVKVGISSNVEKRASSIRCSVPDTLTTDHKRVTNHPAREVEKEAHRHLKPWHASGEWFSCPVEIAMISIDAADGDVEAAAFLTEYREHEVAAQRALAHRNRAIWMRRYKARVEPDKVAACEAVAATADAYACALRDHLKIAFPEKYEQSRGIVP